MPESPATRDLKSLFCERFKCPPSEYEKRALRKCLYLHARIIGPLLRWLNPRCFERDRVFIDGFGKAEDWQAVMEEIAALRYQDAFKPQFTRKTLRLRVSGGKAAKLANKLFTIRPS
jgi:hypothetical protein